MFNKYLRRATLLQDKKYSAPAKALQGTLGYMDRLLGISATKMRNRADATSSLLKNKAFHSPQLTQRATRLDAKAKGLTSQTKRTRIKTGLLVGGAALVHKANQNYFSNNDYSAPQYYQPY